MAKDKAPETSPDVAQDAPGIAPAASVDKTDQILRQLTRRIEALEERDVTYQRRMGAIEAEARDRKAV